MFFRSRKGIAKGTEKSPAPVTQADSKATTVAQRVPSVSAASPKSSRSTNTEGAPPSPPGGAAAGQLGPEELKKRAAASKQLAATMGELVGLMARSPRHKEHKLSDIRWLVAPAIRTGQYSLATAQSKANGYTSAVAAVLWASVSDEVNKRIASNLSAPIRLAPREWKSGDNLWLVDAIGDNRLVNQLVSRLQDKEWKDKVVKARIVDGQKQISIRTIEPPSDRRTAAAGDK